METSVSRLRFTYIQERKWLVQKVEGTINAPIQPCMISTWAESGEILFMLDGLHLGLMQWVVVLEITGDAAVL